MLKRTFYDISVKQICSYREIEILSFFEDFYYHYFYLVDGHFVCMCISVPCACNVPSDQKRRVDPTRTGEAYL